MDFRTHIIDVQIFVLILGPWTIYILLCMAVFIKTKRISIVIKLVPQSCCER